MEQVQEAAKLPSKHLLVLKTSSRPVLKTFSTRLQRNNFSSSKTSCKDVLKTSRKTSRRRLQDVLGEDKFLRWRRLQDVLKTSSRCLVKKKKIYWGYLHLANLNVYLTNLYFPNIDLTKLRQIQNALIWTQWFQYSSYFETQATS